MESEFLNNMRKPFILTLLVVTSIIAYSQTSADTIRTKPFLGSTIYTFKNKPLTIYALNQKVSQNIHAAPEMQLAYKNFKMGATSRIVGAGCLGWSIGTILAKKNPNYILGAVGVGLLGVSIRFDQNFGSHARVAIRIFNSEAK